MPNPGYALNRVTPARHVATELDGAFPEALSLGALAHSLSASPADLERVRTHENTSDPKLWLIEQAIKDVDGLERDGDQVRMAVGMRFDDLRYEGEPLHRLVDLHAQLGDPFNVNSGRYADNVREVKRANKATKPDPADVALRESMKEVGWLPGSQVVKDARTGVVITGHRRLAMAEELGIEVPDDAVLEIDFTEQYGAGDPADLHRLDAAYLSNWGFKPLTSRERAEVARYLQETRGLTQREIAKRLGIHPGMLNRDLRSDGGPTPAEKIAAATAVRVEKARALFAKKLTVEKIASELGASESQIYSDLRSDGGPTATDIAEAERDERIKKVKALSDEGNTLFAIAEELGISPTQAGRDLRADGGPTPAEKLATERAERIEKAKALSAQGWSQERIAKELGISQGQVSIDLGRPHSRSAGSVAGTNNRNRKSTKLTDTQLESVLDLAFNRGIRDRAELALMTGAGVRQIQNAIMREETRREALADAQDAAEQEAPRKARLDSGYTRQPLDGHTHIFKCSLCGTLAPGVRA